MKSVDCDFSCTKFAFQNVSINLKFKVFRCFTPYFVSECSCSESDVLCHFHPRVMEDFRDIYDLYPPGGGTCQNFDRDARPIFWV